MWRPLPLNIRVCRLGDVNLKSLPTSTRNLYFRSDLSRVTGGSKKKARRNIPV